MADDADFPEFEMPPRHEVWREEYRQRRYLEHFSQAELNERAADVLSNLLTLTAVGQIGLRNPKPEGEELFVLWTHVLEEFVLRHGPYPNGFTREVFEHAQIVKATYPDVPAGYTALQSLELTPGAFLLKFGKEEHLRRAYDDGELRIAPASFYGDPSLNPAVRDDELRFGIRSHPSTIVLSIAGAGPALPLELASDFRLTLRSRTNYYVFCLAYSADHRLFGDFDANACLAITDPNRFFERLRDEVAKCLPDWRLSGRPVTYADPCATSAGEVDIFMTKHFRYAYQREYRLRWVPPTPVRELDPLFVKLGSLHDIARLVTLP